MLLHHKLTNQQIPSSSVGYTRSNDIKILTKVVAIKLCEPTGTIQNYALLDDGFEISIIEEDMAKCLGLMEPKECFELRTANGITSEYSCHISVHIQGTQEEQMFPLANVRTIKNLPLWNHAINITKLQQQWKHLHEVQLPSLKIAMPTVLIGQDHWELIVAKECITSLW